MTKQSVYLGQVSNRFGDQVFLPYSIGIIQAFCHKHDHINRNFCFEPFLYVREAIGEVVAGLRQPRIVGISCYVWNWEYSKVLAREIKASFPECLIIMGGPQVPERSHGFFREHPYVDILVHNEGEIAFYEILCEFLESTPDYTRIRGLSVRLADDTCYKTERRLPFRDLDQLPSPYLAGVFDPLVGLPYRWNACHETNRGCPYSCVFCSWSSAVSTRLRVFDESRLVDELEWFGEHGVEILYSCDANYGILERDYELTCRLVEVRNRYGYPAQFRPAFAKSSNRRVFRIAQLLQEADLQKGVTLSVQSMSERCLELTKRRNASYETLSSLFSMYRTAGIPTYTEVIIGLPGETYETFTEGISKLLCAGQHDGCCIYTCELLPNSELADPAYMLAHGIKSVKMPLLLAYATPAKDNIQEYAETVVETHTLPQKDWEACCLFAWAVQCFHCLNLTQYLAVFMHTEFGLGYDDYYESLLAFSTRRPETLIGREYLRATERIMRLLHGEAVEAVVPEFGPLMWSVEEAAFLHLISDKATLYAEVGDFTLSLAASRDLTLQHGLLSDLIAYQSGMLVDPFSPVELDIDLSFDLPEYFHNAYVGARSGLRELRCRVVAQKRRDYRGDLETYALEVVRYGRKRNKLPCQITAQSRHR